ncbi:hypothetical protein N7495_001032 [Penicillium taxi]|uniref:uncharacterized protein n=1 Tax=Penicillium taxi TaxID=168475 RepID=UPI002545AC04|nr:uncharacterized protein N7495_001032 [Penicillium taxi]KAJ5908350.1 hypothetical protein N7495_001032 [Penicillium taxi]
MLFRQLLASRMCGEEMRVKHVQSENCPQSKLLRCFVPLGKMSSDQLWLGNVMPQERQDPFQSCKEGRHARYII